MSKTAVTTPQIVGDLRTPLGHRLTPVEMVEAGLEISRMGGPYKHGVAFLDGLIDLILFLPLDELTALRATVRIPVTAAPEMIDT